MTTYTDAIEAAISREKEILGADAAVQAAQDTEGLSVDEDGRVTAIEEEGKAVLGRLVEEYKEEGGSLAVTLIARHLRDVGADDIDLPDILDGRM